MKQLWLLLFILPVILWTSCETETLPSESPQSLAENILSRSNGIESLPEGSKILLNARGGVTIEDKIFTYTKGSWSNDNEYQWENANETTYITALHPHDINDPYEENALKDILIAQDTLSQGETDITLTFKHLFASFTLNVEESLIDDIAEIKLTSPKSIESISSSTGEITLSDISTTTTLSGNGNNSYEFIIPPMEASLSLGITLKGGTSKTYTLKNHLFKSGFKYECKLRGPGIVDADDLIEFCKIINGTITGDLSKYGKMKNGKRVFQLLANIPLTEENCKNLRPIGNENHPFSDIFEGNGYTISNFIAHPYDGVAGLFGIIDTTGVIKNIQLYNCSTPIIKSSASSGVGLIAGICKGLISDCSVTHSQIDIQTTYPTGGITGSVRSNGTIINSYSSNNIISSEGYVGGVVGKLEKGNIINCFSASNTITKKNHHSAGFCGYAYEGNIKNCYVYNLTLKGSTERGQFIGYGTSSSISYCFTDTKTSVTKLIDINYKNTCTTTSNGLYESDFSTITGQFLHERLNQWKNDNQSSYDYTFTPWTEDQTGTLPAIFTP